MTYDGSSSKSTGTALMRRLRAFALSNGTAVASTLPMLMMNLNEDSSFVEWWAGSAFRLAFVVGVLTGLTKREDREVREENEPSTRELIMRMFFVAAPIEAYMTSYAMRKMTLPGATVFHKFWFASFVAKTFLFEVLMDLGHYAAHRLVHSNAFLYKISGHKTHHAVHKPTAVATFCQDPFDVVLSNLIPVWGSLWFLRKYLNVSFTRTELLFAMGYKTYIEVAGHVGVLNGRATSFPQMVWLPRLLGIELHTRDHDLHHTHGGRRNFAKRFTLFDRVFGTYQEHPRAIEAVEAIKKEY